MELRLPSIYNDIDFVDFILLEAIRIFDYRAYEWIYKARENLTLARKSEISFLFRDSEKPVDINEDINNLVNALTDVCNIPKTKELIIKLFSLNSYSGYEGLKEELNRDKRLASSDYFEQYFSFKVLSKNIPDIEFKEYINSDQATRYKILTYYKGKKLIHTLLKGLKYRIQKDEEKTKFNSYYKELIDYCDAELLDYTTEFFEQSGWFVIINFLVEISHEHIDDTGYDILFEELLFETTSYTRYITLAFLRNRVMSRNNHLVVSSIPQVIIEKYKERIIQRLRELLLQYAEQIKNNKHDFKEFTTIEILRLLHEVDPLSYSDTIDQFIINDANAVLLFKFSLTRFVQSGNPDVAYLITNEKHIMPYLTVAKFSERLSLIDLSKYSGSNKEFLELFFIISVHLNKADFQLVII